MTKLLGILILILAVILFPPASLAVVSNNAVPGDTTYPIKRGLEDVIYAIASLNPITRAWFSAARSDRRFEEIKLLAFQEKSTTDILNELVSQADTAVSEIDKVENASQKKELLESVQKSIEKYDLGLKELSEKVSEGSVVESPKQSSENLRSTPTSEQKQQEEKEPEPDQVANQPPAAIGPSQEEIEKQKKAYEEAIKKLEELAKKAREAQEAAEKLLKQQQQQQKKDKKRQKENERSSSTNEQKDNQQSPPDAASQQQADNSQTQPQASTTTSSNGPTQGVAGYLDLGNGPIFSGDDSTNANCKSDCDACPSQTVCGEKTYDTCEDNFGRKSTTSTFCSGEATHFRCYAKDNIACRSIDPNDQNREFIYPCSACNTTVPTSTTSSPSSPPASTSSPLPTEYYPDE